MLMFVCLSGSLSGSLFLSVSTVIVLVLFTYPPIFSKPVCLSTVLACPCSLILFQTDFFLELVVVVVLVVRELPSTL